MSEKPAKKPIGRPKGKPRSKAEIAADAKRTGRPITSPTQHETKLVALRLTPKDFKLFISDAKKAGMLGAAYARHCWRLAREIEHGNDIQDTEKTDRSGNRKKSAGH